MVYCLLSDAADAVDPSQFKSTDLYRRCLAAGVIPASVDDLKRLAADSKDGSPPVTDAAWLSSATGGDSQTHLDLRLVVEGMWCPACAWVIEEALKKSPGIHAADCNFSTDRVYCRFNPLQTASDKIAEIIKNLGYRVKDLDPDSAHGAKRQAFLGLLLAALLSANVMMLSFALYSGFFSRFSPETIGSLSWPIFFMASGVVIYCGLPIFRKAWSAILAKAPGMEVLISVGTLSAYGFSIYNLTRGSLHLYFDTACMLITLVLIGKTIEERARRQVQQDLDGFFALQPTKVRILCDQWPKGRYVHADQLTRDDIFQIEAGETVPADGVVLEGRAIVDESAITGEARPVAAEPGSSLKSGTSIVEGQLKARAERVGKACLLGQMIEIMEHSLSCRMPLEDRTERILKWFTPLILILALFTGLFCYVLGMEPEKALIRAVTVMVIACPCALGIAIPMARMAAISAAARRGVLVRDFSAFEAARQVDTVVFDKTGTLTTGQWELIDIKATPSCDRNFILSLSAGLEAGSRHFIAGAILRAAAKAGLKALKVEDLAIHPNGITGHYQGMPVSIGNREFVGRNPATADPIQCLEPDNDASVSRIYLRAGEQLCGTLMFGDRLRPSAMAAIERLRARNFKFYLVSGDDETTTRAIAGQVGLSQARGGLLPQEKANFIDRLRGQGHRVVMVGDGINDAPALSWADLAVAVYSGHHLAKDTAHITLMRADCAQLPEFFDFAARVNRKIQQNLGLSLAYNLISIPVAMAGLLSPLVAVTAMLLSSLSVTGNTLLLIRGERRR
jgi:heavy metal translocating P-type ATPase